MGDNEETAAMRETVEGFEKLLSEVQFMLNSPPSQVQPHGSLYPESSYGNPHYQSQYAPDSHSSTPRLQHPSQSYLYPPNMQARQATANVAQGPTGSYASPQHQSQQLPPQGLQAMTSSSSCYFGSSANGEYSGTPPRTVHSWHSLPPGEFPASASPFNGFPGPSANGAQGPHRGYASQQHQSQQLPPQGWHAMPSYSPGHPGSSVNGAQGLEGGYGRDRSPDYYRAPAPPPQGYPITSASVALNAPSREISSIQSNSHSPGEFPASATPFNGFPGTSANGAQRGGTGQTYASPQSQQLPPQGWQAMSSTSNGFPRQMLPTANGAHGGGNGQTYVNLQSQQLPPQGWQATAASSQGLAGNSANAAPPGTHGGGYANPPGPPFRPQASPRNVQPPWTVQPPGNSSFGSEAQELASKLDRLQLVLEKRAARKADLPASSEPSAYQQAPASIQNMILQRPKAQPKYPTMIPDLPATTNSFPFRGPESPSSAASGQRQEVQLIGPPHLPAGDSFAGSWVNNAPEGWGMYKWGTGGSYTGEWQRGVKQGKGTYTWPDGSVYEGQFNAGLMKGEGNYTGGDGGAYRGQWLRGMRHGLGYERFTVNDEYNGLWETNEPHGPGRYHWKDGSEYNGEMVSGRREGRGTFVRFDGEMYFGECVEGVEHGRAVHTKTDRSFYDGVWVDGHRHGAGVSFPSVGDGVRPADNVTPKVMVQEYNIGRMLKEEEASAEFLSMYKLPPMHAQTHAHLMAGGNSADDRLAPSLANTMRRQRRGSVAWGKEQVHEGNKVGESLDTYSDNYDLMLNLKLGIQWCVSTGMKEQKRTCDHADFTNSQEKISFPRLGSQSGGKPPHASKDFEWKEYFPMVFRNLRDQFKTDGGEFMRSLCGEISLRELPTPGKSGAAFFVSNDDKYFIKTMTKGEVQLFKKIIQKYYEHMMTYKNSLLVKFYGMYWVGYKNEKLFMVVMGNLLASEAPIHRRYDLKGSTIGRFTSKTAEQIKQTSVMKDLDIDVSFIIAKQWRNLLLEHLRVDCVFLEENGIMDYSMLLGVHFRGAKSNPYLANTLGLGEAQATLDEETEVATQSITKNEVSMNILVKKPAKMRRMSISMGRPMEGTDQREVAKSLNHRPWTAHDRRTSGPTELRRQATQAFEDATLIGSEKLTTESLATQRGRATALGEAMVATAFNKRVFDWPQDTGVPMRAPTLLGTQEAVLEFGVIDILQAYNVRKTVEHVYRSVQHRTTKDISSVNPFTYSERFQKFMQELFVSEE